MNIFTPLKPMATSPRFKGKWEISDNVKSQGSRKVTRVENAFKPYDTEITKEFKQDTTVLYDSAQGLDYLQIFAWKRSPIKNGVYLDDKVVWRNHNPGLLRFERIDSFVKRAMKIAREFEK